MALSRELTRRLEAEDEPLAKRLKLAENAFTSADLPVTRKEDLVLKWLCQVVETVSKDENVVWETLQNCLRFKNLSSNFVIKSEIKESLVKTLIDKLTTETESENVLQCCHLMFATCEMQKYFQSKPAGLADLMKALFISVFNLSKHRESGKDFISRDSCTETVSGRRCAASAVECFVTCYKQSLNKDDFADLFLREILHPLCSLIDTTGSDKLGAEIHKCIQQLIFGKSRYSQFKAFDGKDDNNFARKVFTELKKHAETADEETSLVVFLYIFRAAVGSYKSDPIVIDLIFRNLMDSAGRVKIRLFGCLREHLANITFDYQNKVDDTTLSEYLQKIIDGILLTDRLSAADFDALAGLAILNPIIIETKLQEILKKILLVKKETTNECSSYTNLMISILNAEVRLRREQKLVPWILTAIKQTLNECSESSDLNVDAVFPNEFKDQFTKTVVNMTSVQMIGVFRSLIFHLNTISEESFENDNSTSTFMLQANVDLMAAFFRGVKIFDHSVPATGQEKFAQALNDLGKTLLSLTEKILKSNHDGKTITALLTVTWYWDKMHEWLKYYAPDATPKTLEFPISEAQMRKISRSIGKSENQTDQAMNKILAQKMRHSLPEQTSVDSSSFFGGFEKSWSIIIDENPQLIPFLDNHRVSELASFLLEDARASESTRRLSYECVQNDEKLVKALVCQTFVDIAGRIDESTTKTIVELVNVVKILDRGKISKVLRAAKEEVAKNEWRTINSGTVECHLETLLHLPLTHISLDLRTLVLLVMYAMKKESDGSIVTRELCTQVILDVTEKSDIDIFDYIETESLVRELTLDIGIQRAVESSLRKVSSWETLKGLIKYSDVEDESVAVLLECIERAKSSSLKPDRKELLKKAEHKLSKKLLKGMEGEVQDHREVKRLSMALTAIGADADVPDNLIDLTRLTLDRIFSSKVSQDEKLVAEGLQLVRAVLKKRSKFEMSQEVVENVWPLVIKNPSKELVGSLLETTQAKPLNRILNLLHKQTILGLDESNVADLANSLIIWESVTNAPMKAARDKFRIAAILNVLEALEISKIPEKSWPDVLKLVQSIFARHSHAIERGMDVILMLAARSLREIGLSACEHVLAICSLLLKFNIDFVVDRLPVFLALYRQLVKLVVRESRDKLDSVNERKLRCLALDVAKFTNSLVKLKKELARNSPYVIADLVELFSEGVIPSHVKGPLEDSVGHFLSICDSHAISLLSRALPAATQEIFKNLYVTYNKFYKYTGKI